MESLYRKKVLTVFEQFDGSEQLIKKYEIQLKDNKTYLLPTIEGLMEFHEGDFIATGPKPKCEHWAVKQSIFEKTYEKVE